MPDDEILIRGAAAVVTMDGARREIAGGDVLLRGGVVAAVGQGLASAGEVVEAAGCVVTPGLVNTHHLTGLSSKLSSAMFRLSRNI